MRWAFPSSTTSWHRPTSFALAFRYPAAGGRDGASERDRGWEARLRRELPPALGSVTLEFLAGQSTPAVLKRVGELGPDSVVFTPGYFEDSQGNLFNPRDAAALMATQPRPVYGPFETFIGRVWSGVECRA